MSDTLFSGLFTSLAGTVTLQGFFICLAAALVLGAVIALTVTFRAAFSRGFALTLALIPAIVCVVILMVSGIPVKIK